MVNTVITKGFKKPPASLPRLFTAFAAFGKRGCIVISERIVYPASSERDCELWITGDLINLYWCKHGWMTGVTVLTRRAKTAVCHYASRYLVSITKRAILAYYVYG